MIDLAKKLLILSSSGAVIAGVGNSLRGDDGAGPYFISKLRDILPAEFIDCGVAPENYLEKIIALNPEKIIIVDAVNFNKQPGFMKIFPIHEIDTKAVSTHNLSLDIFAGYLQARIKKIEIFLLGIQPKECSLAGDVSIEIKNAVDSLVGFLEKKKSNLNQNGSDQK